MYYSFYSIVELVSSAYMLPLYKAAAVIAQANGRLKQLNGIHNILQKEKKLKKKIIIIIIIIIIIKNVMLK